MNVRLFDLKTQHAALEPQFQAAFTRVCRSGQYILGPEVEAFEQLLAEFNQVPHALGVSSGTDALLLALMALGIGPGDEVLLPSFTFFATAGCVSRLGARPVFVDSCPVCFNLDWNDARRRLTTKTKAIIPVHLFGQAMKMGPLLDWARENNLFVIEDAAQAMGAAGPSGLAGALGDFGTFSFFPTKNLGAMGDAGALVTSNPDLYLRAKRMRNHGMDPKYHHASIGGNFRLDALQAALLAVKLPHFAQMTEARRRHALFYSQALSRLPEVVQVRGCSCSCQPPEQDEAKPARFILPGICSSDASSSSASPIWNQFTLRVPSRDGSSARRDAFRSFLSERGVATEIYYPLPLHRQACFAHLDTPKVPLPWADRLAREVVSLPIYPELTQEELDYVVETVALFA